MVASWIGLALISLIRALCDFLLSSRRAQHLAVIAVVLLGAAAVHGDAESGSAAWLRPMIGEGPFAVPGTYMYLSPGRAAAAWSRDGKGQVSIDIPPDKGEVLYAIGFDRTLDAEEVLVQVGADRPMPIEVFIETEPADWRSRHSVVLELDGSGVQTFVVPLSQFKQSYYTSPEQLGVHFPESVRASLPGLEAGTKAYAAGIVVNGFPRASTPSETVTAGRITLRQLGKAEPR